ncbi:MAG: hypothetical protein RIT02_2701 [Planctomycetota bacterium]|jgi:hypothetical protein
MQVYIDNGKLIQLELELIVQGPEGIQTTTIKTTALVTEVGFVNQHNEKQILSCRIVPTLKLINHGEVVLTQVQERRQEQNQ